MHCRPFNHRHEVLIRKTNFRLNKIIDRLDVLNAYLIAFLNLDEVIRIIREEDQPKEQLIETSSYQTDRPRQFLTCDYARSENWKSFNFVKNSMI